MIVRDAKETDYPEIIRMGRAFAQAADQPDVDPDPLISVLNDLPILKVVENGEVCGMAAAVVYPHYWSPDTLVAQELWWWVDETARGSRAGVMLLEALEESAKVLGASKLMMLALDALNPDGVERLYRRRGYVPQERTFVKELS